MGPIWCWGGRAHLDSGFVTGRGIIVARSDTLRRRGPQLPTLPFSLLLDRLHLNLVLRHRRIRKHFIRLCDLTDRRPVALVRSNGFTVVAEDGLVGMSLARDPAFTLVVDGGDVSRIADDGGRIGELDVRGSPDEALDLESGCRARRGAKVSANDQFEGETADSRSVMRYVSLFPPGSETVNVACPFCLTAEHHQRYTLDPGIESARTINGTTGEAGLLA